MSERSKAYAIYLKSDHWKDIRKRKFEESGRVCKFCNKTRGVFNVHHINYKNWTDCQLEDLLVLCKDCHDDLHVGAKRQKVDLAGTQLQMITYVIRTYRLTDAYRKRKEKIEKKLSARQKDGFVRSGRIASVGKAKNVIKKALRLCKKNGWTMASIENLVVQANKCVAAMKPI